MIRFQDLRFPDLTGFIRKPYEDGFDEEFKFFYSTWMDDSIIVEERCLDINLEDFVAFAIQADLEKGYTSFTVWVGDEVFVLNPRYPYRYWEEDL